MTMNLTDANTYLAARNVTAWTGSDASKTAALLNASDYIGAIYAIPSLPTVDQQAVIDGAIYSLAGSMITTPRPLIQTAPVKRSHKELAGTGTIETEYFEVASDPYPLITAMLLRVSIGMRGAAQGNMGYYVGRLI